MFHVATPSTGCIDYEKLVPNPLEKPASGEILKRWGKSTAFVRSADTIVFHASRYLGLKDESENEAFAGPDTDGRTFLPWCLMRCAETAELLSIESVRVDCDREAWRMLQPSLDLIGSITGRRLVKGPSRQIPFFRSRAGNTPRHDALSIAT